MTGVITILLLSLALRKAKDKMGDRYIPFFSVIAAAIFAGQMLNFTLVGIGGTSGHLIGAALAAILFGPYGALIILTLVLLIQALFFADGGIIALGANIFNMGLIGAFVAYITFVNLKRIMKGVSLPAFFAGFFSVVMAAVACALELGFSGTVSFSKALIAMVPLHAVIGIGEGLITVGIVKSIQKSRPDLLKLEKIKPRWW
ncbi:MAG: energy-coupling factor ABC transporter permease [Nanobdellota archaeon]